MTELDATDEESADLVTVRWLGQHESGPHAGMDVGMAMEIPRNKIIDGLPAPYCTFCPDKSHRMTLVDEETYRAVLDNDDSGEDETKDGMEVEGDERTGGARRD